MNAANSSSSKRYANPLWTLKGHKHWVNSVVFSPDSRFIASCSQDKTIRVWDMASGAAALPIPLKGHTDGIMAIAYSANGEFIGSGSNDKTLRVWYSRDGRLRNTFVFDGSVYSVAFSPRCRSIACATGCDGGKIKVVNLQSSIEQQSVIKSEGIRCLAYSPDGRYLATGSKDSTIQSFTTDNWEPHGGLLSLSSDSITSLCYSPNGRLLAAITATGSVGVWTLSGNSGTWTRLVRRRVSKADAWTAGSVSKTSHHAIAFSPDGCHLACTADTSIRILSMEASSISQMHAAEVGEISKAHSDDVRALAYSPDGNYLASGSGSSLLWNKDYSVRIWQIRNPRKPIPSIQAPTQSKPSSHNQRATSTFLLNPQHSELPIDVVDLWMLLSFSANPPRDVLAGIRDWTGYLTKGKDVGNGGFGDVAMGNWVNIPNLNGRRLPLVVVKTFRIAHAAGSASDRNLKLARQEIKVCQSLRHENIVPFVGITSRRGFSENERDTVTCLNVHAERNPGQKRVPMLLDVAKGVDYLHHFTSPICQGVVHGDIKSENILVDEYGVFKLADFGLSKMLSNHSFITTATSPGGSLRWMAPELIDPQSGYRLVTTASDIYAFAITAWEILTGRPPFPDYHEGHVVIAVVNNDERPKRPPDIPNWLWALMTKCWARKPEERPQSSKSSTGLSLG